MQNIRGYYDRKKLSLIQVTISTVSYWSVHPVERGKVGVRSLFYPAKRFTVLENIKIWCKIQVLINPFLKKRQRGTDRLSVDRQQHIKNDNFIDEK